MHGAANDFVVVDHRTAFLPDAIGPLVRRLCDRRRGVGADGVLLLERDPELDFAMRYFNADGGPANYCGNGARCVARLALDLGLGRAGEVRFRTAAGVQSARRAPEGGAIELQFGRVERGRAMSLEAVDRVFAGTLITPGVPHFVVPVDRVDGVSVGTWGGALRRHPQLGAGGANVDFVAVLEPGRVAMRTYERGVEAETLACGSGAIASALWAAAHGHGSPVRVLTAGGDELRVTYRESATGYDVGLSGPAEISFAGEWIEPAEVAAGRD
jgi:diaminopimelate epimerase